MSTIESRVDNILNNKDNYSKFPEFPKKNLLIEVTNYCNNKCLFCANRKMTRKKSFINKKVVAKVLKECYNLGSVEVGFYATGEPLISNKLEEYISMAKRIGYEYIYITTNGILANKERVNNLFENGLDSLKFSINALNKEKYKLIHGTDNFNLVIKNLDEAYRLKEKKYKNKKISVSYITTKYTLESTEKIKEFFKGMSDEVIVNMARNQGGLIKEIDYLVDVDNNIKPPCFYVFKSVNITCEGYMTACCMDFQNYLAYADIKKMSIKEAWNSNIITNLRKMHMQNNFEKTICSNCINGTINEVDPICADLATKFDTYNSDLPYELKINHKGKEKM